MTAVVSSVAPTTFSVDVAIVGGGIAGAATAVALARAGIEAHVFERAQALKEVGGPLIVREPSVKLLEAWHLQEFHDFAVSVDDVDLLDMHGELIMTSSMDFRGDGATYSVHRADLHDLIVAHVPAGHLHLARRVASVQNTADGEHAVIDFEDGSRVSARLVIGADGIQSVVRKVIRRDEAHFQGSVVCRMIAPVSALPEGMTNDRCRMWVDGPRKLLTVPMRAGALVAVDAILDADIAEDFRPESLWNAEIPPESLLERFADFDPVLLRLIERRLGSVRADLIYDREVIDSWSEGRIVLAGDAAHPMAPRQAQGANQAIQDAGALADGIAMYGLDDPTHALGHYHDVRHAVATALQEASRIQPEQLGGAPAA